MMKKDISKVNNGYTHGGCFHADDVIATAFLLALNPKINIHRVLEVSEEVLANESNIVYDIGLGRYDHHQEVRKINDYGYPYSAFGLLWEDFGKDFLKEKGFTKIETAFTKFKDDIVSKIDQGDNNGYDNVIGFRENYAIKRFNANWYEIKVNPQIQEEQFKKALQYATLLLDNWIRKLYESVELIEVESKIISDAIRKCSEGILVLEESVRWRDYISADNNIVKIVITKNVRGGYMLSSVNSERLKITQNDYLSFVHASGFMGVASTLDDAVNAARLIVRGSRFNRIA